MGLFQKFKANFNLSNNFYAKIAQFYIKLLYIFISIWQNSREEIFNLGDESRMAVQFNEILWLAKFKQPESSRLFEITFFAWHRKNDENDLPTNGCSERGLPGRDGTKLKDICCIVGTSMCSSDRHLGVNADLKKQCKNPLLLVSISQTYALPSIQAYIMKWLKRVNSWYLFYSEKNIVIK